MCGIYGRIGRDASKALPQEKLLDLSIRMRHRGPDDEGFLSWNEGSPQLWRREDASTAVPGRVSAFHRRLTILDLTTDSWQPMRDPAGRFALIYNGEIYNYLELRPELAALGWSFQTTGDTEVLLAALILWGHDAFARLEGMYAFALFDFEEQTALLARDLFGIKPLFYQEGSDAFTFASELRSVMASSSDLLRLDRETVKVFMRWGRPIYKDQTLISGIRRLQPGEILTVSLLDGTILSRGNQKRPEFTNAFQTFEDASVAWRQAVARSVSIHLRSDVPLAFSLSGGVDSSTMLAMARQDQPDMALHAFTFASKDQDFDELDIARRTAEKYGAELTPIIFDDDNFEGLLEESMALYDEPTASVNFVAEFAVYRAAKQAGYTVILTGQGPDEMMAGYSRFRAARVASELRRGHFRSAFRILRAASGFPDSRGLTTAVWSLMFLLDGSFASAGRAMLGRKSVCPPMNPAWFQGVESDIFQLQDDFCKDSAPTIIDLERCRSTFAGGLQGLLAWGDQATMAVGMEGRLPFLTPGVLEVAMRMKPEHLVSEGAVCKHAAREAMRGIVPDEVLDVRRKIGFEAAPDTMSNRLSGRIAEMLRHSTLLECLSRPEMEAVVKDSEGLGDMHWRAFNLQRWCEVNGVSG